MVKGGDNIKLSINFGLIKPLKSLIYKQYRVLVFNCNSIKSSIVNIELDTITDLINRIVQVLQKDLYWIRISARDMGLMEPVKL